EERGAEVDEPGRLAADDAPGGRVVERRREEARGVREGERVADPVRDGDDLARDEAEEDDGKDGEDPDERGRSRLAREGADERAGRADGDPGEGDAGEDERQAVPRLAAGDPAGLDGDPEPDQDREPEHDRDDRRERDLRRDQAPEADEPADEATDHVLVALGGERARGEHEPEKADRD